MSVFFYEPYYDVDRFIENFNGRNQNNAPNRAVAQHQNSVQSFKPRMDLYEDAEKNLVTATFEFPGVKKEDVQLDVQSGRLIISAVSKASEEHDEKGYAVKERRFGSYSRVLQLPRGVQDDEIKASMANGILTVTFPKSAPEQGPKKISIS